MSGSSLQVPIFKDLTVGSRSAPWHDSCCVLPQKKEGEAGFAPEFQDRSIQPWECANQQPMSYQELFDFLQHVGKDPSRLVFEDELTGIQNRRFLLSYLEHKVRWEQESAFPLALAIIDIDHFKQINDTHGHEAGDQALAWFAEILKSEAGDTGFPIRYGGDEFVLFLPGSDLEEARARADSLLEKARQRKFRLRVTGAELSLTLSIGVASAPTDARTSKELFQIADAALYSAKRAGRNRVATSADIDPTRASTKAALHRLDAAGIVGRRTELSALADCLDRLMKGESQFVVVEASSGMGKTTFLDTVQQILGGSEEHVLVRTAGDPAEGFRPYYLTTRILAALLNKRDDRGEALFRELSPKEIGYLRHVLPQLPQPADQIEEDERSQREGIFIALARFIPRALDNRPLVLLVDDLAAADEATLLLFRWLQGSTNLPMLVCGTSMKILTLGEEEESPLRRFFAKYHDELGIQAIQLRPLKSREIAEFLRGAFPGLDLSESFATELERLTHGNPLFLTEIARKLVANEKIKLVGRQWVLQPLGAGYLPRSLEEVVLEKISALNESDREFLARASALGEDVPVSLLTGSSQEQESAVLEFVDRAAALGLVKLDFQLNDETMRFLGKRVLEISYGAIEPEKRKSLHESIGDYQEGLAKQRLMSSASVLAYHFQRSANQEKARRYEQMRRAYGEATFNGEEAVNYSGELPELDAQTELPLDEEALRLVHDLLRSVLSTVRSLKLYPTESPAIARARGQVKGVLDRLLNRNSVVRLSRTQRTLRVNDQALKVAEYRSLTKAFIGLMDEADLDAIRFRGQVPERELDIMLQTLAELEPKKVGRRFWRKLREERNLQHVEPQQLPSSAVRKVRKSKKAKSKGTSKQPPAPILFGPEEELREDELAAVPDILRSFLGAAKNARLYPIDSQPVTRAVKELHDALETVLNKRAILNLACTDDALIVNGAKVNTHDYTELTQSFLAFVDAMHLNTISFSAELSEQDVTSFIDALRQVSARSGSDGAWDELIDQHELAHVSVNQASYELAWRQPVDTEEPVETSETVELEEKRAPSKVEHSIANASLERLQEDFPVLVWKLLEERHSDAFLLLLGRLFEDYASRQIEQRERTIRAVSHAFEHVNLAKRSHLAQAALHDLLECLRSERDPKILPILVALLNQISMESIQIGDYQIAGLVVQRIRERRKRLREDEPALVAVLDDLLKVDVDTHASSIVQEDLCSDAVSRHRRAAEFLGVLGEHGISISIEIIKQEKSLRVRQLAARMLADVGVASGRELKRALALEITVEQRFRILEVIDLVTRDLKTEITYCLGDGNPKIRRAAFRLAERMKDNEIIEVVAPFAHCEDVAVVKGTVRSLAQMGSIAAAKAVTTILDKTRDPEVAIACCQGLGQIGDPASVRALVKALGRRRRLGTARWWPPQVRATAALALAQIRHPWAIDALRRFARDPEAQVRQIATSRPAPAAARLELEQESIVDEPADAAKESEPEEVTAESNLEEVEEEPEPAESQVVTKLQTAD